MSGTIAVVIINFNKEHYLEYCLNSIINQYSDIDEIVIVDDCSTDNSLIIINNYSKKYPKISVILNETNSGPSYTRDKGIRKCKSEFVMLLDSDDFYEPDYVKRVKDKLLLNPNLIVVSGFNIIDAFNKKIKSINVSSFCRLSIEKQLEWIVSRHKGIPGNQFAFSYATYVSINGLDTTLRLYEDWDLQIRLVNNGYQWCVIDGIGYNYRKAGDGLSSQKQIKHLLSKIRVLKKNFSSTLNRKIYLKAIIHLFVIKGFKYISNKADRSGYN